MTNSPSSLSPVWAVVPAAGLGVRMGGAKPKQYLPLADTCILQVTLNKMLALPQLAGVVVAVQATDSHWPTLSLVDQVQCTDGGESRAESVLNALAYLLAHDVDPGHWVLVHDAARPCVRMDAVAALRQAVESAGDAVVGGILAQPVANTLKRVNEFSVECTVDRSRLWQAHTPQLFRLGELHGALQKGLEASCAITDEASAMEQQGMQPLVVEDYSDNIKITRPEDLALAEMILRQQQLSGDGKCE